MSRRTGVSFFLSILFCLIGAEAFSQTAGGGEKKNPALKYHSILKKRPESGYLFDRFYNTWLDHSTAESLQEYLQKQIKAKDTTANRLMLAFLHSKQNDDVAAIDEFAEALKRDPSSATGWYYKARAESRTLDFEAAVSDLKEARRHQPNAKQAIKIDRLLGTVLMRNQKTKEAIAVWKELLDAHPDDEELFEDVIELHIEEGLFEQAVALSKALIVRTKDPYVAVMRRLRLGDIHHRAGRREKAVEVYSSALGDSGLGSWLEREILAQIEQIYRLEDDLTGLKKQYVELLKTYPKRIGLHRRRCRLLIELGENDEAIKGYRKIIELTPGDRGFREEYVAMLSRLGRHAEAVKELKALCGQHPKDAELQVRLAKILHKAKKTDEAIEAVRHYLKISDGSEYSHLRAARLVDRFGDKTRSLEFYRKLSETFADSPSAQEAYAGFLYTNDRKEDALAIWKKLAQAADVNLTLNIVRALTARGENGIALELLTARQKDFGDNPLFLGQLVNVSLREKKYEQCLPSVKRRVELAKSVSELKAAVSQAVTAFKQSDKLDEAITELEAAKDRPVQTTCLLAELLECVGESERADGLLEKSADQGESLAVGQQVRLCCLRGDWSAAAAATRRLLELSGGRKSQHVRRLVELYERDYKLDEALKWAETWKRLSPGSTAPWLTEARLLQLQGKENEAQNSLRKAIQRFEKDEDIRASLAQTYESVGKYNDAERVYRQLYEKSDDLSSKLRWVAQLADLAEQGGTVSQLVEDFEQRRRTNRRSIVPLLALAEIHRAAGEYEGRRRALLAATNLKPDDLQLLTHIARIEEKEGDWKAAASTLERAAKLDKTVKTRRKIARLHLEYGDAEEGFALLRELINDENADPRIVEGMADALCGIMEWERAAELLRERISTYPGDYRLHYLLAVAYEEAGRTDEAVAEFVRLLDNQEELAKVKKNAAKLAAPNQSNMDMVKDILPAGAIQLFDIQENRHMAYYHRQNSNSRMHYGSMGGTSPSGGVSIPTSVEAVRPFALVHLLTLSEELDETKRTALLSELKSHGVHSPKMMLELGEDMDRGMPDFDDELEANPDDELLLTLVVLSGFNQRQATDTAPLVRAFEKFRRNYKELAFLAAIQAASKDKKHAPLLDQAIEVAAKIERPNPLMIMGIATTLGSEMFGGDMEPSLLEKEQREKLVKMMLDWYPRIPQGNNQFGPMMFYAIVSVLRTGDDPTAYFNFLEEEVSRYREKKTKHAGQSFSIMYYGRRDTPLLEPLGFPPDDLTDFPENVRELTSSDDNNSSFLSRISRGSKSSWEPKKLEPLIKKVKDPTLRLLLAHQYEQTEIVDAVLKEMLAERAPRLDAYLLAAGKAGADEKYAETVMLLEKARHLPMKKAEKKRLDAALVTAVLSAKENAKADEDLLKAGRDAALRLRRQRMDKSQREQLIVVLDDLGLKKEAEKLEKRILSSPGGLSFSGPAFVTPARSSSNDRIEQLIAEGKLDLAARLLANNLKSIGQQVVANPGSTERYMRQAKELTAKLSALELFDEVLKQFAPGKSKNPLRIREFALANELLGRKKEARKAYEQVLVQRPKDDMARMRLIMLMEDSPLADLDEHLDKISDKAVGKFGSMLYGKLSDYESGWDKRFRCADLALRLLPKLKGRPRADTDWAKRMVSSLGNSLSQHSNNTYSSLPSLYEPRTDENNDGDKEEYAKERKRKAKLHRDFCLIMLDMPGLEREGFRHLLAAAEARGDVPGKAADAIAAAAAEKSKAAETKDAPNSPLKKGATAGSSSSDSEKTPENTAGQAGSATQKSQNQLPKRSAKAVAEVATPKDTPEDFHRYAQKVLTDELSRRRNRSSQSVTVYYSSSDPDEVRFRSPEEYLVDDAWKTDNWEPINGKLLPKLAKGRNKQPHKSLTRLIRLYRCPAEEFLAAAKEIIKEYSSSSYASRLNEDDGLTIVVEVWAARSLKVDLEPMLMECEKRKSRGRGYGTTFESIGRYLELLVLQGQLDKARNVIDQMSELYLGPEKERIESIKKHYKRHNVTYGTPNGRIHVFVEFLQQLSGSDPLVFLMLMEYEPLKDVLPWNEFHYRANQSIGQVVMRKPKKALAMLETSPWLGNVEQFRVLSFGDDVDEWPLVEMLENACQPYYEDRTKPFWKCLEESQKASPTFGKGLLLAVFAQKSKKTALLDYLGDHLDGIKKLPQERQDDLAAFAKQVLDHNAINRKTADMPAWKWMAQCRAKRYKEILEKFEKAKRLEDMGADQSDSWEIMTESLPDMIAEDPQVAKRIFFRMLDFAKDYTKRKGHAYYLGSYDKLGAELLENVLDNGDSAHCTELAVFVVDVLSSPEGERIMVHNGLRYSINKTLIKIVESENSEDDAKKNKLPVETSMKLLYERLGEALNGRSAALLIPGLSYAIQAKILESPENCEKAIAWAKGEMESGKYPALAADMYACSRLISRKLQKAKQTETADSSEKLPETADYVEHFRKYLVDEKLPLSVRFVLAKYMANQVKVERMPVQLKCNISSLYVTAIENAAPIEDLGHRFLLNVLYSLQGEPEFKALYDKWSEQFARRYLRVIRTSRSRQNADPSLSLDDSKTISQALAIYLSADDTERVNQLLNKYVDELGESPSALAQLVRFGKNDLALRLFRKHLSTIGFDWSRHPIDQYRKEIADNLPEFLSKITKDDEKLFAEIVLASMPTAEDVAKRGDKESEFPFINKDKEAPKADDKPPKSGCPSRDDRLAALVDRFKKTKFRNKAMRTRAISGLIQGQKAAALLTEEIAAEYESCGTVLVLQNENNHRMQDLQPLVLLHVANRLVENDVRPFIETLEKMTSLQENNYRMSSLFVEPLLDACLKSLDKKNVHWSEEQGKTLSDSLLAFMKSRSNSYYGNRQEFNTLLLLSYLQSGRLDELQKISKDENDDVKSQLANSTVSPRIWKDIKRLSTFSAEGEPSKRIDLVHDVLQVIFTYEWFHWSSGHPYRMCGDKKNLFDRIVTAGLLSDAEMIEHGPAMVEKLEKVPVAKACLASWLHEKKEYEKAEPLWRSAIAEAPKDKDSASMKNYWNWGLYNTLETLKRHDEAKEVLKLVDQEKIKKKNDNHGPFNESSDDPFN